MKLFLRLRLLFAILYTRYLTNLTFDSLAYTCNTLREVSGLTKVFISVNYYTLIPKSKTFGTIINAEFREEYATIRKTALEAFFIKVLKGDLIYDTK